MSDMTPAEFRAAAHRVVDVMADYLERVEQYAVFPAVEPGAIAPLFPAAAPQRGEPLDAILDDFVRLVEPNATHWQHPGFLALFATTASGPGILGEMLTAALGQNPMVWQTSPIGTELEGVVVGWLRDALGLPAAFDGLVTDTASTSTLISLAAAREAAGVSASRSGLDGRPDLPDLRVYASEEAHSSIERACITLGLGAESLVRIPIDAEYRLRVDALRDAIAADRAAGRRPIAVVAALGTTSSTSIDPIGAIADVAAADDLWLHVDAAYAGSAAIVPELRPLFDGWERADSIVVNPHKWLFVPLDASLLLTRRMDTLRAAFSLVPEHLLRSADARPVRNYNEYTPALGRRFRALKLWVHLRWFGLEGLRTAIREHVALAGELASWVAADPDWELLAPTPFSTVCFRYQPARSDGARLDPAELDRLNEAILAEVNAAGDVWLSPTRLHDRFTIRVAVGNLRTERRHVVRAWERLREAAARVGAPAEAGAR